MKHMKHIPIVLLVLLSFSLLLATDVDVNLEWDANSELDLAGYNIYRSTIQGQDYSKLNLDIITNTTYQDVVSNPRLTYYYVATALNIGGEESDYSNEVMFELVGFCPGDANMSGAITVSDAAAIQRHITGLAPLTGVALLNADANESGSVTVSDVTRIHQSLVGINPLEPCQ